MKPLYYLGMIVVSIALLGTCNSSNHHGSSSHKTDDGHGEKHMDEKHAEHKTPAESKEPTYKIANLHAKIWDSTIEQILEIADAMPEDMMNYQPHDSLKTFAEQLVHISAASKGVSDFFLRDIPFEHASPDKDIATMTKSEIKKFVLNQMEMTKVNFLKTSDEDLMEEISSFSGNKMTRLEGLFMVQDHTSNHKAKLNLYLTISGNEPVPYRYY